MPISLATICLVDFVIASSRPPSPAPNIFTPMTTSCESARHVLKAECQSLKDGTSRGNGITQTQSETALACSASILTTRARARRLVTACTSHCAQPTHRISVKWMNLSVSGGLRSSTPSPIRPMLGSDAIFTYLVLKRTAGHILRVWRSMTLLATQKFRSLAHSTCIPSCSALAALLNLSSSGCNLQVANTSKGICWTSIGGSKQGPWSASRRRRLRSFFAVLGAQWCGIAIESVTV
mmetsp:Transcript_48509/g.126767  ORF Transcript_48509/g.126767 Transcript_48509/m.126767 type:complete len:237 (+) Transcript_48509:2485-3195(+)